MKIRLHLRSTRRAKAFILGGSIAGSVAIMLRGFSGLAADVTWTNSAADSFWNTTSANWSTGSTGPWSNGLFDGAILGSTGVGIISVTAPINLRSLNFTATGYTLNGAGSLNFSNAGSSTLAGSQINVTTGTATINVALNTPFGLNKIGGGNLVISAGGSGMTLGSTVNFNNDITMNLYVGTGTTATNAGTVTLANSTALPTNITVGLGGGNLDIGANNVTIGRLVIQGQNALGGSTGQVNATGGGILTVTNEINVLGNSTGFGNRFSAGLNVSGTQLIRVGNGSNGASELVLNNVISGGGGITKTWGYTTAGLATSRGGFSLQGNNTYTGATVISGDTVVTDNVVGGSNTSSSLTVSNAGVEIIGANGGFGSATSVNLTSSGNLVLDNVASTTADGIQVTRAAANVSNRLNPAAALNLTNGSFQITGAASAPSNQTFASINSQKGLNFLTLSPGTSGTSVLTTTGALSITSGSAIIFRSATLPDTTAVAQAATAFVFGSTPSLVGGIIVGATGAASTTSTTGTDFVRYNATNNIGIVRLAAADYGLITTPGANATNATSPVTVASTISINSLRSTATATYTLNAPLTIASGMILSSTGTATFLGTSALDFGAARGYLFGAVTVGSSTDDTPITGSGGLTKTTSSPVTLNGSTAGLSGGIIVNGGGTLTFASRTSATAFTGSLDIQVGQATFSIADSGTGAVNLGLSDTPANVAVGTAKLDISNALVASFSRTINVLGNGGSQSGGYTLTTQAAAGTQNVTSAIALGNNLTLTGGATSSILNLSGPITGNSGIYDAYAIGTLNVTNVGNNFNGEWFKTGTGITNFTGSINAGTGGTRTTAGTLVVTAANNLGSGAITLVGGTLRTDAAITFAQTLNVAAASTLNTNGNNVSFAALTGTVLSGTVLTKSGLGTLTITGAGDFNGNINLATGTGALTLSGGGTLARLGTVTLGQGAIFNVDNSASNLSNRVGPTTNIAFSSAGLTGGATMNLTTNAATDSFSFGTISLTGGTVANPHTSTLNLIDGGAGDHTFTFSSLSAFVANNTLNVVGTTNLGRATAGGSRIFFTTAPTTVGPLNIVAGISFTGFGGTSTVAEYDPTLGLVALILTPGSFIDNINNVGFGAPTATTTNFLANVPTTANLGATIRSLFVVGQTVTLTPGVYAPQAGNLNAAANTLVLTSGALFSYTAPSAITASSSARLQFGSSGTTQAAIETPFDLTLGANVTPVTTGGLLKTGAGVLTILGTNQITGAYNVSEGSVVLPATGTSATSLTGAGGTTLDLGGGTLTLSGTGGVSTTFAGAVTGVAGSNLTLGAANTNTLTLSTGTNTFTGAIQINGGTLVAGSTSALGNAANAVTVGSGGTLAFTGNIAYVNANPVSISGVGAAGRSGAIDNLSGTNSFAAPITLTADATIGATSGSLTLSGGLLGAGIPTFNVASGATVTLTTIALNVGTNALVKNGAGLLVLPNLANTMGNQNVNGGLLRASADNNLGANTNSLNLNNGGFQFGAAFTLDAARPIVLGNSGGTIDTNTFSSAVSNTISGAGSFTKAGTGTLTLSTAKTYLGNTTITGGVLALGVTNALPATGLTIGLISASSTTPQLDLNGFDLTVASLTITARGSGSVAAVTGAGVLTVNGAIAYVNNTSSPGNAYQGNIAASVTALDLGGAVRNLTVAGQNNATPPGDFTINTVIRNGGLNITASPSTTQGTVTGITLNGAAANTYALGTTLNAGTLNVAATTTLGTGGLTINQTGTVNSGVVLNSSMTIGTLATGSVTTSTRATLAISGVTTVNQTSNATFAGVISGAALTKSGNATLTLSGTNSYTGATNVNQGTLLVSGSISGSILTTVTNAGSTLGGTGTVGAVTVNSGAILQGGDGTATGTALTSGGAVSLLDGSVIKLTLGTGGTHSSLIRTGGAWSFDNVGTNQAFEFTILPGATATTYDNVISGLTLAGTEAGLGGIGTWVINTPGVTGTFSFDNAGGVDLTLTAIPEPGTAALLVAGLPLLGLRRRRR